MTRISRFFSSRALCIQMVTIAVVSLWIRMAFPIFAQAWAAYDDLLFVRWASQMGRGSWLGAYDELTHAKGVGFSLFLLANHFTGLPLKFTEHALYLATAACFAITVGRLYHSRAVVLVTFFLLAFIPTAWVAGAAGRVVREGLYISQALMLVTLGIRCWVLPAMSPVAQQLREQRRSLILMGLLAGWFWITREEGVWLLPAMLVLLAYWVLRQSNWRENWRSILVFLALPLVMASLLVGLVNTVNYVKYGVYRNNDFRSSDFQAGYAALTRIRHDQWQRYVPFPQDARERAYEMSAAARELRPYFEGSASSQEWLRAGCEQTKTEPCTEILSGWFMWSLRQAVAQAGHYRSAKEAQAFYLRLASEIDEGCRQRPGDCFAKRASMVPPWHEGYAMDALRSSWAVFETLATLGNLNAYIQPSEGEPQYLALFNIVTNGPLALPADLAGPVESTAAPWGGDKLQSARDTLRIRLARWFAGWINQLSTYGLPLAFIGWLLWSAVMLRHLVARRQLPSATWWVTTALAAAVTTRVVLLGFLDATSIPSNNMLYLFPLVPLSLAMLPVVFWGVMRWRWPLPKNGHNPAAL